MMFSISEGLKYDSILIQDIEMIQLTTNEMFIVLVLRKFDFLISYRYEVKDLSIRYPEPGVIFENKERKRRIIIYWGDFNIIKFIIVNLRGSLFHSERNRLDIGEVNNSPIINQNATELNMEEIISYAAHKIVNEYNVNNRR
jgi:hypothetical protein